MNGYPIDFGTYINADEMASALKKGRLSFTDYSLSEVRNPEFVATAINSGLVGPDIYPLSEFEASYSLSENSLILKEEEAVERLAQIAADFIRKKLLEERKKFSFETVFSHHSKLEIIQEAKNAGYKVNLYFVATRSPEINIGRVKSRVSKGGHNVPSDRITARYYRALELVYDAAQLVDQAYFFDNSETGPAENSQESSFNMFASFKCENNGKDWDIVPSEEIPSWFFEYYINKVEANQ